MRFIQKNLKKPKKNGLQTKNHPKNAKKWPPNPTHPTKNPALLQPFSPPTDSPAPSQSDPPKIPNRKWKLENRKYPATPIKTDFAEGASAVCNPMEVGARQQPLTRSHAPRRRYFAVLRPHIPTTFPAPSVSIAKISPVRLLRYSAFIASTPRVPPRHTVLFLPEGVLVQREVDKCLCRMSLCRMWANRFS
jgi:hypothetical protein